MARNSEDRGLAEMAPTKKSSSDSKSRSSVSQHHQQKVKGENFYRDAKQVKRLKMLSGGKAVRDRNGKIIPSCSIQKGDEMRRRPEECGQIGGGSVRLVLVVSLFL